jgi:SAM-dependent methyltransferase
MTEEQKQELARAQRWYVATREKVHLLPDQPHRALVQAQHILDVGCGEGLWVIEQAKLRPYATCIGLDLNARKIDLAALLAEQEHTRNALFFVDDMNCISPYKIPNDAFGFIRVCNVAEALLRSNYQKMAKRLFQLCQPGGFVAWTEAEFPVTTSRALDAIIFSLCRALERSGHTFRPASSAQEAPDLLPCSRRTLQIQAWLGFWLTEAGFAELDEIGHMLVVTYGQPLHAAFVEQVEATLTRIRPLLIRTGVLTDKQLEGLFASALKEIRSPGFGGMLYLKTVCARKPDPYAPRPLPYQQQEAGHTQPLNETSDESNMVGQRQEIVPIHISSRQEVKAN